MSTSNEGTTQQGNYGAPQRAGSTQSPDQSTPDLKQEASRLAQDATRQGKAQADHYRDVAADKVDQVAGRIKAAAGELDHGDDGPLSSHITSLADSMGRLSSSLREKSADELLGDVNRLARQNPGMFVAGGLAVGFGLARLMKATASASGKGQYQGQGSGDWSPTQSRPDPGMSGYRQAAPMGTQDSWDQGSGDRQGSSTAAASGTAQRTATGSPAASGSARSTLSTSGPGSADDAQPPGKDDHRSKLQ